MISAAIRRGLIEAYSILGNTLSVNKISAAIRRGLIEARIDPQYLLQVCSKFPRPFAAASLKHATVRDDIQDSVDISAAIRRGLIEARGAPTLSRRRAPPFPRPFAAASLKRRIARGRWWWRRSFPRPFAAASLKRQRARRRSSAASRISAAIRRGLIEASSPAAGGGGRG